MAVAERSPEKVWRRKILACGRTSDESCPGQRLDLGAEHHDADLADLVISVTWQCDEDHRRLASRHRGYLHVDVNYALHYFPIRIASPLPSCASTRPSGSRARPGPVGRDSSELLVESVVDFAKCWAGGYDSRFGW